MARSLRLCRLAALALPIALAAPSKLAGAGRPPSLGADSGPALYLPVLTTGLRAPVLKWAYGGCTSWCETGWYSSPAVADLDGDTQPEVIGAAYSVVAVSGLDGSLRWRVDPPGGRAWPGMVVADLEPDGQLEIITTHGDGYVHVFSPSLGVELSRQPTPGYELRSLAVDDLDGNGDLEILVASTRAENQWWVYEHDGSVRAGNWPQHVNSDTDNNRGYAAGAFNQNIGVADLDGDGRGEIIGPSDVHYITAYQDDGSQMLANPMFDTNHDGQPDVWSRVGVHVDQAVDLRGYATCGVEHRPNFADTAPTLADLDGDGSIEIVVVGLVYDCSVYYPPSLYQGVFIFRPDRTRWSGSGFDWTVIPIPDAAAAPLSEDYNAIESALPNPVAADLDGDGRREILFASYDGRLHAYWLDKTEHGLWPFEVYNPAEGFYRFASEPVVADLDGNGSAEVIFASWTQKGSGAWGKLHVVSANGELLSEVALPAPRGAGDWSGALAAPTLANIDSDPDLEVVLNTAHSGLVAYDLPGAAAARLLWPTGRGSYLRAGTPP